MQWPAIKGLVYSATGNAPKDNIAWRVDFYAAMLEAQTSGKPLLLDFSASWCPPCQVMKQEAWPNKDVEALANGRFIPVYIDIDSEYAATSRFNVSTIPTVITLTPEGQLIDRAGFLTASQLVDFMSDSLESQTHRTAAATP